jgi:hypothetical protein
MSVSYQTTNDPTSCQYGNLVEAYDYFNQRLFDGRLPRCMITLRANRSTCGFFAGKRFGEKIGSDIVDEIALNPKHFKDSPTEEVLQTLVHEMVHGEQLHFGNPSRGRYHNREWGALMKRVGLYPSNTGKPGGRETGQQMMEYVIEGGPFAVACAELIANGFTIQYVDLWSDRPPPPLSKLKYICPSCNNQDVYWAKPKLKYNFICGYCYDEHGLITKTMLAGGAL